MLEWLTGKEKNRDQPLKTLQSNQQPIVMPKILSKSTLKSMGIGGGTINKINSTALSDYKDWVIAKETDFRLDKKKPSMSYKVNKFIRSFYAKPADLYIADNFNTNYVGPYKPKPSVTNLITPYVSYLIIFAVSLPFKVLWNLPGMLYSPYNMYKSLTAEGTYEKGQFRQNAIKPFYWSIIKPLVDLAKLARAAPYTGYVFSSQNIKLGKLKEDNVSDDTFNDLIIAKKIGNEHFGTIFTLENSEDKYAKYLANNLLQAQPFKNLPKDLSNDFMKLAKESYIHTNLVKNKTKDILEIVSKLEKENSPDKITNLITEKEKLEYELLKAHESFLKADDAFRKKLREEYENEYKHSKLNPDSSKAYEEIIKIINPDDKNPAALYRENVENKKYLSNQLEAYQIVGQHNLYHQLSENHSTDPIAKAYVNINNRMWLDKLPIYLKVALNDYLLSITQSTPNNSDDKLNTLKSEIDLYIKEKNNYFTSEDKSFAKAAGITIPDNQKDVKTKTYMLPGVKRLKKYLYGLKEEKSVEDKKKLQP